MDQILHRDVGFRGAICRGGGQGPGSYCTKVTLSPFSLLPCVHWRASFPQPPGTILHGEQGPVLKFGSSWISKDESGTPSASLRRWQCQQIIKFILSWLIQNLTRAGHVYLSEKRLQLSTPLVIGTLCLSLEKDRRPDQAFTAPRVRLSLLLWSTSQEPLCTGKIGLKMKKVTSRQISPNQPNWRKAVAESWTIQAVLPCSLRKRGTCQVYLTRALGVLLLSFLPSHPSLLGLVIN